MIELIDYGGRLWLAALTLVAYVLLGVLIFCSPPVPNNAPAAEGGLSRDEWVEEARRELIRRCEEGCEGRDLAEEVKTMYYGWAVSLAETYYDEGPNEYSPAQAVLDEFSYA